MPSQCNGTTQRNQRCKNVAQGDFCRLHAVGQGVVRRGFIYVYTLSHLLERNPKKQKWLNQQRSGGVSEPFNPKKQILLKVGYTTQTVSKRLDQWRQQCKQDISLVTLPQPSFTLFSCMRKPQYSHWDDSCCGFVCGKNANLVEHAVHAKLRSEYGFGAIHCEGCAGGGTKKYNIHVEWFLVPRTHIERVFRIIEDECIRFT